MGSKIIQLSKQNQAKQTKANLYRLYINTHTLTHSHRLKSNCMNALKKRSSNKNEEKEEDDDEERNLS